MNIAFSNQFKRRYKKLSLVDKNRLERRIEVFVQDQEHPQLQNHKLQGKYKGYRSINITEDLRAIYEKADRNTVFFARLGTHNELYG